MQTFRTDIRTQGGRELKQNVHVTIKKPQSETLTCNIFASSSSPRSLPTFLDLKIIIASCSCRKELSIQLLRSALPPGRSRKKCNRRELCSVSRPQIIGQRLGMARSTHVWGQYLVRLVSFPDGIYYCSLCICLECWCFERPDCKYKYILSSGTSRQ